MSHQITIEIPDEIYDPLVVKAREAGQTVERFAQGCLEGVVRQRGALIRKWLGAYESDVPDAAERHHYYLGQALAEELKGGGDA